MHCFLIDTSLNLGSLLSAVSTVKSVYFYGLSLLSALDVPHPVIYHIRDSPIFASETERKEAGLQYCLQNLPCLSWERISGVLWYMEEYTALEAVKEYLKHDNGIYKQKSRWCYVNNQYSATLAAFSLANKYYIIILPGCR